MTLEERKANLLLKSKELGVVTMEIDGCSVDTIEALESVLAIVEKDRERITKRAKERQKELKSQIKK